MRYATILRGRREVQESRFPRAIALWCVSQAQAGSRNRFARSPTPAPLLDRLCWSTRGDNVA
jgi:hypothetical protein